MEFNLGKSDFDSLRKWAVGYYGAIRVFFDHVILDHLGVVSDKKPIIISKVDYSIVKLPSGFFLRKNPSDTMIKQLYEIRDRLKDRITYSNLKLLVDKSNLIFTQSKNKFGVFFEIRFPSFYAGSTESSIKIYYGKSIKEATNNYNIDELSTEYSSRLVAKSFKFDNSDKKYYRFYLRKEKNVVVSTGV